MFKYIPQPKYIITKLTFKSIALVLALAVTITSATIVQARFDTSPSTKIASQAAPAPQIEIAPHSGVSGYPISIFGEGFGSVQGTVTILGQNATILEWTPTFVYIEIPVVADGIADLTLSTDDNQSASQSFEVYTIDPHFQRAPTNRFVNIMRGKTVSLQNIENKFCYEQPTGALVEPADFLTDFVCGFNGYIGDGEVEVSIPTNGTTSLSVDLEQVLSGPYYFQFFSSSSWYSDWISAPKNYTIEVSANSTNGFDGQWQTLHIETGNKKGIRLHQIDVPVGGYHWVRINMSSAINESVKLKELRLYQPTNNATADLDIMAMYGDSITEGAFYHIGETGFSLQVSDKTNSTDEMILATFGLSGQNSTGLVEQDNIDFDIYDTFNMDNVGGIARYWGIALGSNDTGSGENDIGVEWSNLEKYEERLDAIVQLMISQNKVPILARTPDTNEALDDSVLTTKKMILDDIDRIAAKYRLIPGPDLYTPMRLNIERDNASWYWDGDGIHQNWEGRLKIVDAWADAFVRGTNRTALQTGNPATATPLPTATPTSMPADTATPIPANTATPTATNTPIPPTATQTIAPTATGTPTGTGGPGETGQILWERWQTDTGAEPKLTTLRSDADFPDSPDQSGYLTVFESAFNQDDYFGQRIRGFVHPPVTGDYTFWLASDDQGELWLSSDDSPANKSMIANVPDYALWWYDWDRYASQTSATITLQAGEAYYIEAIAQEGSGNDYITVAWQVPGGNRELIDGQYLSPPDTTTLQPPGQVTQSLPSGDITQTTPTFVWEVEPTATEYKVAVYRPSTGDVVFLKTYQAADICGAVSCAAQPTSAEMTLAPDLYYWLVQAVNSAGEGPWSIYSE